MATRAQASTASKRAAQVSAIGLLGTNRSEFNTAAVLNVVENICSDFIETVKTNIQNVSDSFVNTGAIENITLDVSTNKIDIIISNHLLFQDLGVNGSEIKNYDTPFTYRDKRPPISVFIEMVKSRNIQLRNTKVMQGRESRHKDLTEEQEINQVAWALSTSIFKKGFKPNNFYSKEIPGLITYIQNEVATFTKDFFAQIIVNNDGSKTNIPLK